MQHLSLMKLKEGAQMTTLTKPTARAASTAHAFEHASDLAASADNAIKRMCDIFAALFGIILLTPLWIIVAAMVHLNDGGPVFFTQERVGLNGKTFTMFKFRTMRVDAEELKASLMEANEADSSAGNSIMFKMANDPRITRIGAFLRKTSIDELPQLFNVLRGDMSLVGPRPPLPSEVAQYEPRVMGKFAVRPGITGLWQISGRSNLSWDETVHLDLSYAQHRSLTLDAWIVLQTIPAILRHEGAY
ncbi:bacterial sugar transferase [Schaalia dentiphila ATCC 17982]|jgi:Sugar transferases involved in lipopolysaccharide synthesis|uniref:Bacterial sugar transferase n=2 Tax=Schaalia TaxID=2529408 RepID=A7B9B1_9ACTO|nr:bacterial sugar transferase [Schaalia odontolytica ATCC 17982]